MDSFCNLFQKQSDQPFWFNQITSFALQMFLKQALAFVLL